MIDQKKRTVRFETSSLLPLKLVLIEAERDLPARTPKEHDVDEELALKLIAQMKKEYGKIHVIARRVETRSVEIPTKQSPRNVGDYFVATNAPRNDIELEP